MATSTTGTGTITLGSAVTGYATLAEAGAGDGEVYTYCIEDGDDFEIGTGTYTSSGTTLSRDTVTLSKIGGTAGTSKINLSGSAKVFITLKSVDLAPASELLNEGTVSSAATLDIVLTSYPTYRRFEIVLTNLVPATDDVQLWCMFSTDGGSSYDSSAGNYKWAALGMRSGNTGTFAYHSNSDTKIKLAGWSTGGEAISNVSAEGGVNSVLWLLDPQNTGVYSRIEGQSSIYDKNANIQVWNSSGTRVTAQDTDAVRFLFESGNIASGSWTLYGYR